MDYKSFTTGTELSPNAQPRKWWQEKGEDLSAAIWGTVKYLQANQSLRMTTMLTSTRLYGNMSLMGLNGLTYSKLASVTSASSSRITYNLVQSVIDTVCSKMSKNKPKPLFLTSGGDYKMQRKAQKLTKFLDGLFYENDAYALGMEVFRDACVWGTSFIHPYFDENDRLAYERVIPSEIRVDDVEGFYGYPRSMYRTKNIDRSVIKELFPGKAKLIDDANQAKPDDLGAYPTVSDEISVVEAWHLPSGTDAVDGKHVISLANGVLFEEEYEHAFFPFIPFHWNKKLFGFWGQGLAEQLQPIQLEINKLLWVIQRSMHLAGSFKILLENGSKIVKEHLNNDIGSIVNYSGTPPQYVVPPMVQPEVYSHLTTLIERGYEQAGISQLSASSKKPEGLDSGKALREYNDIESDRFMVVGLAYERFFLRLAKVSIELMKANVEGAYPVKVPGEGFIETIDWADVEMDEDSYIMQCYPISALSEDPSSRLQEVQEMMQAGLIDPEAGKRLLNYPDIEEEESFSNAPLDYLHEILDKMVDEEELAEAYTPPEPFDDLQRGRKLALQYYAKYKCAGLEEERLDLFRRFIAQIDMLTLAATAPPPPGAAGPTSPPTAPQANPEQPPVSDLLPNMPTQGAPVQ
jgi:hypothetical protein